MANIKLASAAEDVRVWKTSAYSLKHEYSPHNNPTSDISWSHDGQFIASASANGDKITVAYTKSDVFSLAELALNMDQHCVSFSRVTSRNLLSGGKSGEIKLWDLKTQQLKKSYLGHSAPISKVQFNWNDTLVVSGDVRGDVILHNVTTGMGSSPLRPPKIQAIRDLKFSSVNRALFATVSDDGVINLWDSNKRQHFHAFKEAHGAPATSLAFSPVNDMLLTTVGLDKKIVCCDVKAKTVIKTLIGDQPYTSIDFLNDGVTLAAGTTRGKIVVYDLRQATAPVKSFVAHKTSIQRLVFQNLKVSSSQKQHGTSNSNRSASLSPKRLLSNTHASSTSSVSSTASGTTSFIPQLANKPTIKKCLEINSQALSNGGSTNVDPLGTGDVSAQDSFNKLRNLSDDIFSPLRDESSIEKPMSNIRKQPIGAGTSKLFLGDRPITAGVEDGEGSVNVNGTFTGSTSRQLSPTPAPRRRSASFSPRTSRNLFRERQEASALLLPGSFTTDNTCLSPTSKFQVSQLKREVSATSSLPDTLLPLATAAAAFHSSPPQVRQVTTSPGDSVSVNGEAKKDDGLRNFIKDSFEDLEDSINRKVTELRVDMLKEFHIQKCEIEALWKRYLVNEELVAENERLREELRRLQAKF